MPDSDEDGFSDGDDGIPQMVNPEIVYILYGNGDDYNDSNSFLSEAN